MKFSFILFFFFVQLAHAQIQEGFNPDELKTCIALCNSFTFLDLYGSDQEIIPDDCNKTFESSTIGLDNKFQIYRQKNRAIINFRGSTNQVTSWIANFYSAMIPSNGIIKLNNKVHKYNFSNKKGAAVHSGYALAVLLIAQELIPEIHKLNQEGVYDFIITGHSQGGALALMMHAYLKHLPALKLSLKNNFKTYAFANPMCGNETFASAFDEQFSKYNRCFSIINPMDLVTKMPMHYEKRSRSETRAKIRKWLLGGESLDIRQLGIEFLIKKFERSLKAYIVKSNGWIEKFIDKSIQKIDMPKYVEDINYFQCGKVLKLEPFEYPIIKVDSTLVNEKNQKKFIQDEQGNFYRKEPVFFQHKPYNYYVAVLKSFFSFEYRKLKKTYLPENL